MLKAAGYKLSMPKSAYAFVPSEGVSSACLCPVLPDSKAACCMQVSGRGHGA